ncbi:hypothetical protein EXIGLDRAFT_235669 [Exidia glandulosa HHB12029]|uniref:Secreted protein n=1 Tax=Exidia glandulosa HHB12029 TaxID=1314781 RepID=A0A165E2G9_EXIGL|nr:hypothetical protein EXIGLDRAFT_235669 [Exidia glandulosa HHB12029]
MLEIINGCLSVLITLALTSEVGYKTGCLLLRQRRHLSHAFRRLSHTSWPCSLVSCSDGSLRSTLLERYLWSTNSPVSISALQRFGFDSAGPGIFESNALWIESTSLKAASLKKRHPSLSSKRICSCEAFCCCSCGRSGAWSSPHSA